MFLIPIVDSNPRASERTCRFGVYCASTAKGYSTGSITCMWLSQELGGILSRKIRREGILCVDFAVFGLRLHEYLARKIIGYLRHRRIWLMKSLRVDEIIISAFSKDKRRETKDATNEESK